MDDKTIGAMASQEGFELSFMLPVTPLDGWRAQAEASGHGTHMLSAVAGEYSAAKSVMLLVWPYAPYAASSHLSAYYTNSNAAFFSAKRLALRLRELGLDARRAELPARAIASANGIGVVGKNGLLRLGDFGSRIVLETLLCDLPSAAASVPATPPCGDCTACAAACPTGAIGAALTVSRCMKCELLTAAHPYHVMEMQRWYIGCEACMFACPYNPESIPPPPDVLAAFDTLRLINGDTAAARALVGRNITSNGRLTAEAIAFAAREGEYAAQIRLAGESSQFPAVRRAAEWAQKYR